MSKPRQRQHLAWLTKRYPSAFAAAAEAKRRDSHHPDFCYLPVWEWWQLIASGEPTTPHNVTDAARLAALGAWRTTQFVYRFDPDLYAALVATPITGELPSDLLTRLPTWCVYIETPGLIFAGEAPLYGFYAHLSVSRRGETEMRFILDSPNPEWHLFPVMPLRLGTGSLFDSISAVRADALKTAKRQYPDKVGAFDYVQPEAAVGEYQPLVALLLYLCARNADMPPPAHSRPHSRGRSIPEQVRTWDVGTRVGAALRTATSAFTTATAEAVTRHRPRPHWRRAHWHTYWTGCGENRAAVVKWLPPVAVGCVDDATPVTVTQMAA